MKRIALMTAGLMLALASVATAGSGEAPKPDSPRLAAYERTGQEKTCVSARRIRSAQILNSHQILFEMYGSGPDYLNEPEACGGLRKNRALSYQLTADTLCSITIVHVIDPSSPMPFLGSCSLGKFQELKKKKTASAD